VTGIYFWQISGFIDIIQIYYSRLIEVYLCESILVQNKKPVRFIEQVDLFAYFKSKSIIGN